MDHAKLAAVADAATDVVSRLDAHLARRAGADKKEHTPERQLELAVKRVAREAKKYGETTAGSASIKQVLAANKGS